MHDLDKEALVDKRLSHLGLKLKKLLELVIDTERGFQYKTCTVPKNAYRKIFTTVMSRITIGFSDKRPSAYEVVMTVKSYNVSNEFPFVNSRFTTKNIN